MEPNRKVPREFIALTRKSYRWSSRYLFKT